MGWRVEMLNGKVGKSIQCLLLYFIFVEENSQSSWKYLKTCWNALCYHGVNGIEEVKKKTLILFSPHHYNNVCVCKSMGYDTIAYRNQIANCIPNSTFIELQLEKKNYMAL